MIYRRRVFPEWVASRESSPIFARFFDLLQVLLDSLSILGLEGSAIQFGTNAARRAHGREHLMVLMGLPQFSEIIEKLGLLLFIERRTTQADMHIDRELLDGILHLARLRIRQTGGRKKDRC